ncbi:MAG TPA: glycosyltransferase family 39 protein [Saprospiraceae bacterium]|nr:glycosyltransferase family 39 protein [Saprospiraceae bacterium]HMQ82538.1 glycosyltransferase family 39 protein [Saprospiraceae bacterium]
MEHFIGGILLILVCGFLCWRAWVFQARHKVWMGVCLLVVSGFLLRAYVAADLYLHPWDERYHALVAKNRMENPFKPMLYKNPVLPYEYKNWAANHIWVHKQPLPLWIMAGSMRLLGCHEWALRLPAVILTCLGILLTFLIGKTLYNDRIGFIAAFLYAIHGLIIELSGGRVATDHIDVFFLFLVELAVWLALEYALSSRRIYTIGCAVATGLAILTKWLPALIVLPLWILFVFHFKKVSPKRHLSIFCCSWWSSSQSPYPGRFISVQLFPLRQLGKTLSITNISLKH